MANNYRWKVSLQSSPFDSWLGDYRRGYFPRIFYYKKDALELIKEVERKGGKASLLKVTKMRGEKDVSY